jgi:hypothetical protein
MQHSGFLAPVEVPLQQLSPLPSFRPHSDGSPAKLNLTLLDLLIEKQPRMDLESFLAAMIS